MTARETDQRPCVTCDGSDDEGLVLLCEACNLPMHADCVGFEGPVLGDWLCPVCEVEDDLPGARLLLEDAHPRPQKTTNF